MTVAPHAQPFAAPGEPGTDGRRIGVVLSHGFTGSPASMRPWGEHLAAQGYAVSVPRLPGHGTTWQEMNTTTFDDWYGEIDRAYGKLAADCDVVVAGGLSLGGALVLRLAAEHPEVAGLALVNPAVALADKRLLALPVLHRFVPALHGIGNDIKKPGADEFGYDRTPLRALSSQIQGWKVVRAALPRITCPVLLFHSVEDHVVDPSSARAIMAGLSSRDVEERMLEDSYHVATLDNDAPRIFAESDEFFRRVVSP